MKKTLWLLVFLVACSAEEKPVYEGGTSIIKDGVTVEEVTYEESLWGDWESLRGLERVDVLAKQEHTKVHLCEDKRFILSEEHDIPFLLMEEELGILPPLDPEEDARAETIARWAGYTMYHDTENKRVELAANENCGEAIPSPLGMYQGSKSFLLEQVQAEELELFRLVNQVRREFGVSSLVLDERLMHSSKEVVSQLFTEEVLTHHLHSEEDPHVYEYVAREGEYREAGENLARNFSNISEVVEGWKGSSGHHQNLLHEGYKQVGYAVKGEGENQYIVQHFADMRGNRNDEAKNSVGE